MSKTRNRKSSLFSSFSMSMCMCVTLLYVLFFGIKSTIAATRFEQEVLDAHNYYRARHNAPALRLNPQLSRLATNWAQYLLANNRMEHRQNSGYGENIYMASGGRLTGTDAVRSWYDEIKHYNWRRPSFQSNTGHFTQVVWKGSTQLGVGYARRDNTIYVVCNYNPPGNFMNQFQNNVSPSN